MTRNTRSTIVFVAKLSLGLGLLSYFWRSGKLDLDVIPNRDYVYGFLVLFLLQIVIFYMTVYRWYAVAKTFHLPSLTFKDCLLFAWVGQFFASFLPSVVSASFATTYYLHQRGFPTRTIIKSIVVDKIVSATSMVVLFGLSVAALIWNIPLFLFCILVVLSVLIYHLARLKLKNLPSRFVEGVVLPPVITVVISFIAFSLKALSLLYVIALTGQFVNVELFHLSLAGQLFELLPFTPANLGVGHLAFDYLYGLVGNSSGALVYNIYFIVKVLFKATGLLPWVMIRKPLRCQDAK